jgi:hypothetical protein
MKKPIITFLFLFFFQNIAYSYEPPFTAPKEALLKGKIAFIGRITEIREIKHSSHISEAIARIRVLKPLYGLKNPKKDDIYLKFSSRYFMPIPDHGFPAEFFISEIYLIVINRVAENDSKPLLFNPRFDKKIDLAYQIVGDPEFSIDDFTKKIRLYSVYSNQVFKGTSVQKIIEWSNLKNNISQ